MGRGLRVEPDVGGGGARDWGGVFGRGLRVEPVWAGLRRGAWLWAGLKGAAQCSGALSWGSP